MALLMIEGFETRDAVARPFWTRQSGSFVAGRFGGYAIDTGGSQIIGMPVASEVAIVGCAVFLTGSQGVQFDFMADGDSNGNIAASTLIRGVDKMVEIKRGNSTIVKTGAVPVMQTGTWAYVEVKCKAADVGGFIEMRVNGVVVLSYVGDTMGTTRVPGLITRIDISGVRLDDMYICDATGTEFNDYLGEVQIETLLPNASGSASSLTPSAGASVDSWQLVDELPASETDYVQSAIVGAQQLWQFTNPTVAAGQILAVQPEIALTKANAGPAAAKIMDKVDGNTRLSAAIPASNLSWKHVGPLTRDPSGAVWTPAKVAAAEFGIEVV